MSFKAALKRLGAVIYKNRSNIEFVGGLLLEAGGTALIISKAKKAAEIHDTCSWRLEEFRVQDAADNWESPEERKTEKRDILKYAAVEYTKCYALGVGMMATGMALTVVSKLTDNNTISEAYALAASTAAAFSQYRARVVEDQGEEKDQLYLFGPQTTTVEVKEDGTVVQKTEPVKDQWGNINLPPHCFFFDACNCPGTWEKDPALNRDFLENHLRWLNQRLQAEGFLFENDIRRDLGAPIVKCGWTSGIFAEDEEGNTNYLKLGLDAKNPAAQNFRDGIEPCIIIQMNVEDNILDKLLIEKI